ncbi:MAG TPA: cation transporter [Geminicoccaceae bacterium]|nr:cation transporter [Geminicoccaceae bacterium]
MPTTAQKAKEAAVLYTSLADLAIVLLMFTFALATRSLTLLSEAVRVALMLFVEFYSIFVLRAVHRDRLRKFRFGIGKVEQFCNLAIGAALVASGFWVAHRVIDLVLFDQTSASPLGLAMAAVVNAINTLINVLGWFAMASAARSDDSPIFRAQLRARMVKLVSSLFVQTTLTIAALSRDPIVSLWLDSIGAAFVAGTMICIGLDMIRESVPDLLDHAIPEAMKRQIDDALVSAGVKPEEVVRLRTRRSGSLAQVELTLAPTNGVLLADFKQRVRHIEQMIESRIQDADVAIVVDDGGG